MIQITPTISIDERDIEERFVRASDPGTNQFCAGNKRR